MILAISLVVYNAAKTEYSIAFRNLDQTDAAAIKNYLDERGIPYEFTPDMSAVGVPTRLVTEVKAAAAEQNLIHSGSIGFGIFTENIGSFGMTDNQFQVLKVDALAGEIEKLIYEYNGVTKVTALVRLPSESVFINTDKEQEASVAIQVRFEPGYRPSQKQIDGMYRTVQMTLPNLPMENIVIGDPNGELTPSFTLESSATGIPTTFEEQLKVKKQIEQDIRSNVENLLKPIMGQDSVVASVFATVNFDKKNSLEQLVTPVNTVDQKGIEISLQEVQKTFSSEGASNPGGIVGTGDQDIINYPSAGSSGGQTNSEEIERIVNFDVNRITNEIVKSPYAIIDLTINVGIEPPNPADPESLTQEMRDSVKQLLVNIVSAALANSGVEYSQEQLQQKVLVFAQPFLGKSSVAGAGDSSILSASNAWMYALGGIAVALLLVGGYALIRRRRVDPEVEEVQQSNVPSLDDEALELSRLSNETQVRKQLNMLAQKKPEEFVNLLRTWLVEE
jgi:flagellar M-ring protein FliF